MIYAPVWIKLVGAAKGTSTGTPGTQQQSNFRSNRSSAPESGNTQKKSSKRTAGAKRQDGRFYVGPSGEQLCYTWNRSANGCAERCISQPARAHLCEWCHGEHRAVDPNVLESRQGGSHPASDMRKSPLASVSLVIWMMRCRLRAIRR